MLSITKCVMQNSGLKKSNVINLKQLLIRFKNYVEIHIQYKLSVQKCICLHECKIFP